jgi:hypothetical protein
MRSALRVIGTVSFLICSTASAQDAVPLQERIDRLAGYWISGVNHDAGAVVLRFVRTAQSAKLTASFRPARAWRWETAEGIAALRNSDTVRIELRRAEGGRISLELDPADRLRGDVTGGGGPTYSVAFVRTTLPDIHQWVAEHPRPAARGRKHSTIELLYVSAADCGHCRRWEAKYLDQQKPRQALGWDEVRFSVADIGTFRAHFGAADVPLHLRPAMVKILDSERLSSLRGTPWYALFVNGELRCHALGTNAFETLIQPAIRAALRERSLDAPT